MRDRKAPCRCGSGRQYRNCCRPRDRALEDGGAAAVVAHEMIDGAVRVVLRQKQVEVVCRAGCDACCHYLIRTSRVEALPIARFLLQPENATALARFEAGYARWREAAGAAVEELEAMLRAHGGAPEADAAIARWQELVAEVQLREIACPLLDEGSCSVYPVRPVVCRAWNATEAPERCRASSPVPAAVVQDPAIDDAVARARGLMVHAGLELPAPDDAVLPTQVARALADLRR